MPRRLQQCIFAIVAAALLSSQLRAAEILVGIGGCELKDAIRAANTDSSSGNCPAGNGADTLILPDEAEIVLNSTLDPIVTPMTLRTETPSGRASIRGDNDRRVLMVTGTTGVRLERLVLSDGWVNGLGEVGGAGLYMNNSEVVLVDLTFRRNRVVGGLRQGGGLRVRNSTVTIEGCMFDRNLVAATAILEGSTLRNGRGAAMALVDSVVSIDRCTLQSFDVRDSAFSWQWDTGADEGAGIHARNTVLTVTNSLFQNNNTRDGDTPTLGADLFLVEGSDATVRNSTFWYGNLANSRIHAEDSTLRLNNVTVISDIRGYGISARGTSEVHASNSYFGFGDDSPFFPFCVAWDAQGNETAFPVISDLANLFPRDTSCTPQESPASALGDWRSPADNGGPTRTVALRPTNLFLGTNLAVNAGDPATCEPDDQRGVSRGSACDIGAYEIDDVTDLTASLALLTPPPYYFGQRLRYDVLVGNQGPSDAYRVDARFTLNGLTLDRFAGDHPCVGLGCTIEVIPAGGRFSFPMVVTYDGTPTFDAELVVDTTGSFASDPAPSNNIDDLDNGGSLSAAADLDLRVTPTTPPPYAVGQTIEFDIDLENLGPNGATNIVLSLNNSQLSQASIVGCNSFSGTQCLIHSLGNVSDRRLSGSAQIDAPLFAVSMGAEADEFDPVARNDEDGFKGGADADSALSVLLELTTSGPHYPTQPLTYRAEILNKGPDEATNVTVESLTENAVIVGISNPCTFLPCVIPSIPSGEAFIIDYTALPSAPGAFLHTVEVSADQNDSDPGDNTATQSDVAEAATDVSSDLLLLSAGPYFEGAEIEFDVTVKNRGPSPATQVTVDFIPGNLEILDVRSAHCALDPCLIPVLEPGVASGERVIVKARIADVGAFSLGVRVDSSEFEIVTTNDASELGGSAAEPKINQPPVAGDDEGMTLQGQTAFIDVVSNDQDPEARLDVGTVSLQSAPSSGTASVDALGVVTYAPASDFFGIDSFVYYVLDAEKAVSNAATVTVTVTQVTNDDPPIAVNDQTVTDIGQAVLIDVLGNDNDDGALDVTSVTLVELPAHGTAVADPASGVVTYTPADDFSGADSFSYQVRDDAGQISNIATVSVTVNPEASGEVLFADGFET